jgi:SAM-dependent methyltransferase
MSFYSHYATRSKHAAGIWVHRRQAKRLAQLALAHASRKRSLLEIGPGDGYFAEECHRAGISYTGLEGSPELADQQREKGWDVRMAIVPPIPLGSSSVDVCCMFHVLEHVSGPDSARDLICESRRVLVDEGLLVLACPNYYTWGRDFFDDYTHNYITTPRRVRQLLTDCGYEIIQIEFYAGPIFGAGRFVPLFASRLFYWPWLNRIIDSDRYYQGFLTFRESFAIVARPRPSRVWYPVPDDMPLSALTVTRASNVDLAHPVREAHSQSGACPPSQPTR